MEDDSTKEIEEIVRLGIENPLSREERKKLLMKILEVMKVKAEERGDAGALEALSGDLDAMAERILDETEGEEE